VNQFLLHDDKFTEVYAGKDQQQKKQQQDKGVAAGGEQKKRRARAAAAYELEPYAPGRLNFDVEMVAPSEDDEDADAANAEEPQVPRTRALVFGDVAEWSDRQARRGSTAGAAGGKGGPVFSVPSSRPSTAQSLAAAGGGGGRGSVPATPVGGAGRKTPGPSRGGTRPASPADSTASGYSTSAGGAAAASGETEKDVGKRAAQRRAIEVLNLDPRGVEGARAHRAPSNPFAPPRPTTAAAAAGASAGQISAHEAAALAAAAAPAGAPPPVVDPADYTAVEDLMACGPRGGLGEGACAAPVARSWLAAWDEQLEKKFPLVHGANFEAELRLLARRRQARSVATQQRLATGLVPAQSAVLVVIAVHALHRLVVTSAAAAAQVEAVPVPLVIEFQRQRLNRASAATAPAVGAAAAAGAAITADADPYETTFRTPTRAIPIFSAPDQGGAFTGSQSWAPVLLPTWALCRDELDRPLRVRVLYAPPRAAERAGPLADRAAASAASGSSKGAAAAGKSGVDAWEAWVDSAATGKAAALAAGYNFTVIAYATTTLREILAKSGVGGNLSTMSLMSPLPPFARAQQPMRDYHIRSSSGASADADAHADASSGQTAPSPLPRWSLPLHGNATPLEDLIEGGHRPARPLRLLPWDPFAGARPTAAHKTGGASAGGDFEARDGAHVDGAALTLHVCSLLSPRAPPLLVTAANALALAQALAAVQGQCEFYARSKALAVALGTSAGVASLNSSISARALEGQVREIVELIAALKLFKIKSQSERVWRPRLEAMNLLKSGQGQASARGGPGGSDDDDENDDVAADGDPDKVAALQRRRTYLDARRRRLSARSDAADQGPLELAARIAVVAEDPVYRTMRAAYDRLLALLPRPLCVDIGDARALAEKLITAAATAAADADSGSDPAAVIEELRAVREAVASQLRLLAPAPAPAGLIQHRCSAHGREYGPLPPELARRDKGGASSSAAAASPAPSPVPSPPTGRRNPFAAISGAGVSPASMSASAAAPGGGGGGGGGGKGSSGEGSGDAVLQPRWPVTRAEALVPSTGEVEPTGQPAGASKKARSLATVASAAPGSSGTSKSVLPPVPHALFSLIGSIGLGHVPYLEPLPVPVLGFPHLVQLRVSGYKLGRPLPQQQGVPAPPRRLGPAEPPAQPSQQFFMQVLVLDRRANAATTAVAGGAAAGKSVKSDNADKKKSALTLDVSADGSGSPSTTGAPDASTDIRSGGMDTTLQARARMRIPQGQLVSASAAEFAIVEALDTAAAASASHADKAGGGSGPLAPPEVLPIHVRAALAYEPAERHGVAAPSELAPALLALRQLAPPSDTAAAAAAAGAAGAGGSGAKKDKDGSRGPVSALLCESVWRPAPLLQSAVQADAARRSGVTGGGVIAPGTAMPGSARSTGGSGADAALASAAEARAWLSLSTVPAHSTAKGRDATAAEAARAGGYHWREVYTSELAACAHRSAAGAAAGSDPVFAPCLLHTSLLRGNFFAPLLIRVFEHRPATAGSGGADGAGAGASDAVLVGHATTTLHELLTQQALAKMRAVQDKVKPLEPSSGSDTAAAVDAGGWRLSSSKLAQIFWGADYCSPSLAVGAIAGASAGTDPDSVGELSAYDASRDRAAAALRRAGAGGDAGAEEETDPSAVAYASGGLAAASRAVLERTSGGGGVGFEAAGVAVTLPLENESDRALWHATVLQAQRRGLATAGGATARTAAGAKAVQDGLALGGYGYRHSGRIRVGATVWSAWEDACTDDDLAPAVALKAANDRVEMGRAFGWALGLRAPEDVIGRVSELPARTHEWARMENMREIRNSQAVRAHEKEKKQLTKEKKEKKDKKKKKDDDGSYQ
jgi:hypothetical protein